MSNDKPKPKPLSAPNSMGGSTNQEPTPEQSLAILKIFQAAAAAQPDDKGPGLHASEVAARGVPGLSAVSPADREKVRLWLEGFERKGFLAPAPAGIGRSKSVAHGLRFSGAAGGPEIKRLEVIVKAGIK